MVNIKSAKKKFAKKLTPYLVRELFRFLNLYSKITGKAVGKDDLKSFDILSKSVVELFHLAYKKGSIWTTLFVPSELIFAMKLLALSH